MSQPAPTLPGIADARRLRLRPWMPPAWRAAVAGQRIEIRIPEPVARRCRKPRRILPSEWSVRHRRMPAAEAHPGAYREEFARYAAKVMDTWAQPWVREVWYCAVDQATKTNAMLSCIGWLRTYAPGNIFYQMPDKDSAEKIMGRKLIPMFRVTPRLARYLSPRADDTAIKGITFNDGVALLPSWAGGLTSTAIFSARYTFSDEIDKMEMVGKEADPMDRIRKRTRTNRFSKHFFASTPAGKWIYKGTMACQQVWAAAARCPHCGELVVMDEEHLDIPEGATEESIKADPAAIGYMCNDCGERWDEDDRKRAYDGGDWVCIKGAEIRRPVDVGFLLSAFPLPDVPLKDIACTVVRAKAGDVSAKRDLAHGVRAVDFEDVQSDRKEVAILRLRDERPAGIVHPESDVLLLSADTQDNGFWYTIRGWRFGEDLKSWLVKAGYVPSARHDDFSALDAVLEAEYRDTGDRRHRITYGVIDTQGHRTSHVYRWCKRTGVFAARGAQRRKTQPVTVSKIEHFPGTNKPIPGGLLLYHLDTHFHKDVLVSKLAIDPTDPGAWVLHCGFSPLQLRLLEKNPELPMANGLEPYARQMCVEIRDERGLWQNPQQKANHFWDCEQQQVAFALYLGFQNMTREAAAAPAAPASSPSTPAAAPPARPRWFQNRRR